MKRVCSAIFILLLISAAVVMADGFRGMWQDVRKKGVSELPATQIGMLDKIIEKAEAEKSYGNLMKAVRERMEKRYQISPDSFDADVAGLEKKLSSTDSGTATYAVYNSLLGNIYREKASYYYLDETGRNRLLEKSRNFFIKSLSHPEKLATVKTGELYPFFSKKKGNDLLITLSYNAMMFDAARDYYLKAGNRPCALIMSLETLRNGKNYRKGYLKSLDSLTAIYGDLEECGEVAVAKYNYINEMTDASNEEKLNFVRDALGKWGGWKRTARLRNAELSLTRPSFDVVLESTQIATGEKLSISYKNVRNISSITTSLWKTGLSTYDIVKAGNNGGHDEDFYKSAIKPLGKKDLTSVKSEFHYPEHVFANDSARTENLEKGIYIVETRCNRKDIPPVYNILYVSDLYIMSESLPKGTTRIAVVDFKTGRPVKNAAVTLLCRNGRRDRKTIEKICDDKGEIMLTKDEQPYTAYAHDADDKFIAATRTGSSFMYRKNTDDKSRSVILTDRAVYRPGQTVKVAVTAYTNIKGTDLRTDGGAAVDLTVRDANHKVICNKTLTTDEFGTASTEFVLPSKSLNGRFTISDNRYGYTSIRVEEYRRPSFNVEISAPEVKYHFGDTIKVAGRAASYTGVPVQDAAVRYRVKRIWMPWLRNYHGNNDVVASGRTVTSGEGSFVIDVPLTGKDSRHHGYCYFIVEADVTDAAGETRNGNISIPVGSRELWFECDLPEKIEKDRPLSVKFDVRNIAGEKINTEVRLCIDGRHEYVVKSNESIVLDGYTRNLPSGIHKLTAYAQGEKIEKDFILFSLDDKVPATDTDEWFYITSDTFSEGKNVFVQLGSSRNIHVLYSVISGENIIKTGTLELNNEIRTAEIKYKEEYGDGILINYAWLYNGKLHTRSKAIKRQLPDKGMDIKWITFRNRLVPGQKENWTLQITNNDGTKTDASLTATLYDISLDAIAAHRWKGVAGLFVNVPFTNWDGTECDRRQTSYLRSEPEWFKDEGSFYEEFPNISLYHERVMGGYDRIMMKQSAATRNGILSEDRTGSTGIAENADIYEDGLEDNGTSHAPQLRENLSETAFFYPSLTTDSCGRVNISFTLPESITTWRFMAFVHDRDMRNNVFSDEITARKKVMVQPNMPRFVRRGDNAVISARILNLSGKAISGRAVMQMCDAETGKVMAERHAGYDIEKDGTGSVSFEYDADTSSDMLICKIFAEGDDYSDGEQHVLGILSDRETVTDTRVTAIDGAGNFDIKTDDLFGNNSSDGRLTLEYTENPSWLVIQALPTMAEHSGNDVITAATQLYVNELARNIAGSSQDIKRMIKLWSAENTDKNTLTSRLQKNEELKDMMLNETPWMTEAGNETEQMHRIVELFDENTINSRIESATRRLLTAQNEDGSWGWWQGMDGNEHITATVTEMLLRLRLVTQCGRNLEKATEKAMGYLTEKMTRRTESEKKKKEHMLSSYDLRYLYLKSIYGKNYTSCDRWLADRLEETACSDYDIYEKCMAAIILHRCGNRDVAEHLIRSVKEYSVYSDENGRYFDTHRAAYSWYDYKIPTEVMAIEAIATVTPEDKKTIAEMQHWLLQEKRTTCWDTQINSVNAIYALTKDGSKFATTENNDIIRVNGRTIKRNEAGTGYTKVTENGRNFKVNLIKNHKNTSWLSLYGTYTADLKNVGEASTGLAIEREIITENIKDINTGDKIKIRITIKADRDYDFVQITDKRAACMEPVSQISGYNGRYYCSMKDNAAYYYFDLMPKGTHIIETEYYVDRRGSYTTGICKVQCAYAPEFNGRTDAKTIIVK